MLSSCACRAPDVRPYHRSWSRKLDRGVPSRRQLELKSGEHDADACKHAAYPQDLKW